MVWPAAARRPSQRERPLPETAPRQARARPACEWRRSMPRGWAKPPRSPSESRATAACSSHCRRSAPSRARTEAERVLPLRRPDQLCSSDGCCRGRSSCSPRHAYALPLELSAEERPSWCSRTRRPQARALGRAGGTDGASRVPCDCILRYDAIREVTETHTSLSACVDIEHGRSGLRGITRGAPGEAAGAI